jgi:hypothetical protein
MLVSAEFFEEAYVMGTQGMWGRDRGPDGRGEGEKKVPATVEEKREKSWTEDKTMSGYRGDGNPLGKPRRR